MSMPPMPPGGDPPSYRQDRLPLPGTPPPHSSRRRRWILLGVVLVVVDDVITTGATARESVGVLQMCGADVVAVLTLAHA